MSGEHEKNKVMPDTLQTVLPRVELPAACGAEKGEGGGVADMTTGFLRRQKWQRVILIGKKPE